MAYAAARLSSCRATAWCASTAGMRVDSRAPTQPLCNVQYWHPHSPPPEIEYKKPHFRTICTTYAVSCI
eukprot:2316739-Rhodomonas_salina.4